MLDEFLEKTLDASIDWYAQWSAPWKIRIKRSAIGFRPMLIRDSIRHTLAILFNKIKVAGREGGFLQRLIMEPVEPMEETTMREILHRALSGAQRIFEGKSFAALLLMTMHSALLLAARGTAELAVLCAFFCLSWLACAMEEEYAPICAGVRQRYLAAQLLRAGGYLTLLLSYFAAYAAQGLKINVLLQGTMIIALSAHAVIFVSLIAFNKRQQLFLRALMGVLGFAPALAFAAAAALCASTIAREPLMAIGGLLRAMGAGSAFIAWETAMIDSIGVWRPLYGRLWKGLFATIGFFMMLCGAWLSVL